MKQLLFGTTALVAAGLLATPAFADEAKKEQPIQVTIGGYMYQFFEVTQQDSRTGQSTVGAANAVSASNRNNKVFKDKSRLQFDGRTQLDNGLVAGFRIQLRGVTGDSNISTSQSEDQIDEHFAFLDSATYGRMEIGATASAPRKMWYGAVTPAMPVHGFMSPNFVETQGGAQQPTTLITMGGQTDRAQKVTYFTPRIAGFQLGGSYAVDSCDEGISSLPLGGNAPNGTGVNIAGTFSCHFNGPNGLGNQPGLQKNIWAGALNYVNKFGDFDLGVYAGFETADIGAQTGFGVFAGTVGPLRSSRTQAGTGFRVSAYGFTAGAAYRFDNEGVTAANATVASGTLAQKNRHDVHAGLAYGQGPWSVGGSVALIRASRVDGSGTTRDHDSVLAEAAGANYALGPGININAAIEHIDNSVGTVAAAGGFNQIGASEHAWIYTIGTVFNF